MLEPLHRGRSNKYHNLFETNINNKKKLLPQCYYIKLGFKGEYFSCTCFHVDKTNIHTMFSDEEDDYVSTPAEHIGSLQLSAKPMLVPETVDEME